MIAELTPYDDYKFCENASLGKVPQHWRIVRIKSVLTESDRRTKDGRGILLSLSRARGLIDRTKMTDKAPSARTLVGYKLYSPGQIVMNRMQAWSGMFGSGRISGLVSPDYAVYSQKSSENVDFLLTRLKTDDLVAEYRLASRGIGTGFNRLYNDRFGPIRISLPPPDEQELIVRFLDWASVRLGKAIAAKRKVIGLLEEQKQAIIHRAVTRGLDDTVPLKPSGLDWLGDVPEHWEVWRVSRFAKVGNGSTPSRAKPLYWLNGSFPWLNSSQVNRGSIDSADQFVTKLALRECHLPVVKPCSLLVAITGQGKTRGTAAILRVEATINQHVAYITPRIPIVNIEFLQLEFVAAYNELRRLSEDSGSTKGALTCEDLKRFKVCLPPIGEQATIVQDVEMRTESVSSQVDVITREIQLLQEYRTRLIADVVTGKLDVRKFARTLPADISEEAAELASSELGDDEFTDSDDELADELAGEPA